MAQSRTEHLLLLRLQRRIIAFIVFILFSLLLLISRVVYLQALTGDDFYEKSQRVIRKIIPLPAPRGEMFDRHYHSRNDSVPLVSNITTINLIVIPSTFKENELLQKVHELEKLLGRKKNSLSKNVTAAKMRSNEEIILIEDISKEEMTLLSDYYLKFSKFILRESSMRYYNMESKLSHVTGYIGQPSQDDIKNGIRSYQAVGKNGLEIYYDPLLRGEDGEIVQLKTAKGGEDQEILKNQIPGSTLVLTIDSQLQEIAWNSLGDKTGAVVVMKPVNGEILALVSKPDYNPNIMVSSEQKLRSQHIREIQKTRGEINRAISTKYPPASSFKPLVALAALEENRITPEQTYFCDGQFVVKASYAGLKDSVYHCYAKHGNLNLRSAIAQSCSSYFYELGYHMGAEPIIRYARYFRLDEKTGIDLPAEISGFVPSPLWKEKNIHMPWFDGDTINLSIGQGYISTTLMGMVNFYSAMINDGVIYRPHFIKEIRNAQDDSVKEEIQPQVLYELPISASTLKTLRRALREVTISGTTKNVFRIPGIMPIAGKTGTAQVVSFRFANASQHAWYIGYGPYNGNPKDIILVGVSVERGRGGSVGAAPVAADIFSHWSQRLRSKKGLD